MKLNPGLEWQDLLPLVMRAILLHDLTRLGVLDEGNHVYSGDNIVYRMGAAPSSQSGRLSDSDYDGDRVMLRVEESDNPGDLVEALSVLALQHVD